MVGLDITRRMIELAKLKTPPGTPATFLVGDMLALPFANGSFDIVTTGYGLRNVPDLARAVDEILRVLKPGGQALSLDFNRPANAFVRTATCGISRQSVAPWAGCCTATRIRIVTSRRRFASIRAQAWSVG